MGDRVSLSVIVRGQVQGVFFRAFVQHHAVALGLTGFVRNLHGGSAVEVHAEGESEQLQRLLKYVKRGPPEARVEKVEVSWSGYSGAFSSFDILY